MPCSDEALMLRCKEGDTEAFGLLVAKYKAPITRYANYLLADPDQAEDVAQETFLRILRAAKRYEPRARFTTWLYRIAANLCYDELRRRARHPFMSLDEEIVCGDEEEAETIRRYEIIEDPKGSPPDQALQEQEMTRTMERAIKDLSGSHRQVIHKRMVEELSYAQIAEELDTSEGTVKSRMHYATRKLREDLLEMLDPDDLPAWMSE